MKFYPLFVRLQGRPCVVIGGGEVAERKVHGLLQAGARVTLISPVLTAIGARRSPNVIQPSASAITNGAATLTVPAAALPPS